MTKEQYERWSAPFRGGKNRENSLVWVDRGMTAFVFLAYPVLLFYLMLTGEFQKLADCTRIPAVSFLLVSVFRKIYSAPRPYEVLDIQPLIPKETKGKSFPSRHVFSIFMIGMTFFYIMKPVGIVVMIFGIAMAYIRVVGGVHFLKDVMAGALLGILCGLTYFI